MSRHIKTIKVPNGAGSEIDLRMDSSALSWIAITDDGCEFKHNVADTALHMAFDHVKKIMAEGVNWQEAIYVETSEYSNCQTLRLNVSRRWYGETPDGLILTRVPDSKDPEKWNVRALSQYGRSEIPISGDGKIRFGITSNYTNNIRCLMPFDRDTWEQFLWLRERMKVIRKDIVDLLEGQAAKYQGKV